MLIIIHTGGMNGFVANTLLIFKSSHTTGNYEAYIEYHNDMNSENYRCQLTGKLVP